MMRMGLTVRSSAIFSPDQVFSCPSKLPGKTSRRQLHPADHMCYLVPTQHNKQHDQRIMPGEQAQENFLQNNFTQKLTTARSSGRLNINREKCLVNKTRKSSQKNLKMKLTSPSKSGRLGNIKEQSQENKSWKILPLNFLVTQ